MFGKLSEAIAALLPGEAGEELKKNIEALIRGHLEQMNLVSREELDVQQKILKRTRDKLAQLESQVAALEKQQDKS